MIRLRARDERALLSFVCDARPSDGPEPFTTDALDGLASVMECDFATYYQINRAKRVQYAYVPCSKEASHGPWVYGLEDGFEPSTLEPLGPRSADVATWSQLLDRDTRRHFRTTPWAAMFGVVDAARVHFRSSGGDDAVLTLHSQERDFAESDCSKLMFLRPYVFGLIRAADARRLLSDLQAVVDTSLAGDESGFVLVSRGGTIDHASVTAWGLLERWFGTASRALPPEIEDWLKSDRLEPLRLARGEKHLVVDAPSEHALVLAEKKSPPARLTKREIEVLRHIASGCSTAETARALYVTTATVNKHLEHVYRKLGVSSRTAALAALEHVDAPHFLSTPRRSF